jgi:hypothetical protein
MELFGLIGVASYCIAASVVGIRLLLLARRTGQLPERLIGMGFLGGGCLGYTALVAASLMNQAQAAPSASSALFYAGWTGLVVASCCLIVFWERVYHRGLAAARAVIAVEVALLVGSLVGLFATYTPGADPATSSWYLLGLVAQGGAYALNAWSAGRTHRLLRRRLRLGLAEPVVVNRVLLWSAASCAITLQYFYSIARLALYGKGTASGPETAVIACLGLAAAGTMVLAFLPPRSYLRRVERSSAGARG